MFEKEADEYSNNWKINKIANLNFAELLDLRAVIYQAHKDGAEFGYNKANELHKQDYSLFDFVMKYENGKFKCEYKSGKVFESVDGETWKEIVLPKEIKEK